MLAWFLSGIVMMYAPYPQRGETERLSALAPIPWSPCCNFSGVPLAGGALIQAAQVENVADQLVLRSRADAAQIIADLTQGRALAIGDAEARRIAEISAERIIGAVPAILLAEKIENDQWTVGLHRWDFTATLRSRPLCDVIVLFLLLGSTAGVATGVYLAIRRIRLDLGA